MPSLEMTDLKQKALLWIKHGTDRYGQPTVASPIDIAVRFVRGRHETLDAQGNTIALDAEVVVDRDVTVGSTMWLAPASNETAIAQFLGSGSAGTDSEVMLVKTFSVASDLKNRVKRRTVGLMRLADVPPGS